MKHKRSKIGAVLVVVATSVTLALGAALSGHARAATAEGQPATPARPRLNVLFIAVDDLNTRVGAFGHPQVKTPNIDRLATKGVAFQRAYCQYPLCNPSRTSLLSGLRPESTGVLGNQTPPRTYLKDHPFLHDVFGANGYATWRVGKIFHGGGGRTGGFAQWDGAQKWDVNEAGKPTGKPGVAFSGQLEGPGTKNGLTWRALDTDDDAQTPDGATARRIAGLIDDAAKTGKPFFAAAGFHKPHLAWDAPKKYFELYDPAKIEVPKDPAGHGDDLPVVVTRWKDGKRADLTPEQHREAIRAYYAATSFTDANVGVVLEALDRNKLWENTIVVFFGDHGFQLGEHGGWAKGKLWHHAIHAPLIVAAPGAKGNGSSSPRVVEFIDIYPTLVELAGLTRPAGGAPQGVSITPLLNDPNASWDRAAFTVVAGRRDAKDQVIGRSVVTEQFHYVQWPGEGLTQLFDFQADPGEYTNLAADPRYAQEVARHQRLLEEQVKATPPASQAEPEAVPAAAAAAAAPSDADAD